jgi:MAF protein
MNAEIVLASSSPYRKQILESAGFTFTCCSPKIDESALPGETAPELVTRLATGKAQALSAQYPHSLIIGSDQVLACKQEILGKPRNHEDAVRQLTLVSGSSAVLYTGLALVNAETGSLQCIVDTYEVKYRDLNVAVIEQYLETEKPYDCCGSLKVEGPGIRMIKRLSGNDPNTLMGLPLLQLIDMLENEGVDINSVSS